jgi:dTDP-4-dehydrorhamnose reductase
LNSEVPAQLALLVARGGARFLHVSTDAVFDGQRGGYRENDAPNPLGVYARTKLAGEQAVAQANPEALIVRVNLFGWSLSARRSLSEFFFHNLQAGRPVMGFTDVYFCPVLANHLAHLFLRMLAAGLSGLYHATGHECISKYDFGVRLAQQCGLDASLIRPASVAEAGLKAVRSPNLTLRNEKLARALGQAVDQVTPSLSTGLEDLFTLYQQGYPQRLRAMQVEQGREEKG